PRQVLSHAGYQHDFVVLNTTEQDHRTAKLVLQLIDQRQQCLTIQAVETRCQHLCALHVDRRACQVTTGRAGSLGLELLQLLFQLTVTLKHTSQLFQHVVAAALDQLRGFLELLFGGIQVGQREFAGNRFDAAHTGGYAAFAGDLEQADVTGALDVGAATQLDGETAAHAQHTHLVAVLFTEQRHGAARLGRLDISLLDIHRRVLANLGVDPIFQRLDLLGLDRLEVTEVETQTLAVHKRTFLRHMLAQDLAQRGVQQVSRRVVQSGCLTHRGIDGRIDRGPDLQAATVQDSMVKIGTAGLAGITHIETQAFGSKITAVTHLAAGFGIERRLVKHHHALFARVQALYIHAFLEQRDHLAAARRALVTDKARLALNLHQAVVVQAERTGGACALALGIHLTLKALLIDGQLALAGDIGGQVNRETIGVVQLEHYITGDDRSRQLSQILLKNLQALLQGLGELLFFGLQNALDLRLLLFQFGEG